MAGLTKRRIEGLEEPGLYADGVMPTLFMQVARGGSKSWIQRLAVHGRRRDLGLGGWPLTSIEEARERAFENRRTARRGGDPLADKRRARVPTFGEAVEAAYEANRHKWRSDKTGRNFRQQLARYALPRLGSIRIDVLTGADVLKVLNPIWTEKHTTATRVRNHIRMVLAWAEAHGHCDGNVAGPGIDGALARPTAAASHHRALHYRDCPAALAAIAGADGALAAKLALRFAILTATRSGEVRGAAWSEVDLDAREWRIPAARMKASPQGHAVPLSRAALDVLAEARALDDGGGLVFPSSRGGEQSATAFPRLLKAAGIHDSASAHGMRASFRTWASERTNSPHHVMELCLAHVAGQVERAYARGELMDKRRALMDKWASYLTGDTAEVVRLHG